MAALMAASACGQGTCGQGMCGEGMWTVWGGNVWGCNVWGGNVWAGTVWEGNVWGGNVWGGNVCVPGSGRREVSVCGCRRPLHPSPLPFHECVGMTYAGKDHGEERCFLAAQSHSKALRATRPSH
eukprot:281191-Chlamydomonas_euryale.AAC.2